MERRNYPSSGGSSEEGLIMSWGLGRNVTLPTISKYAKTASMTRRQKDLSKRNFLKKLIPRQLIFSSRQALFPVVTSRKLLLQALAQEMKVVIMDEPTKV